MKHPEIDERSIVEHYVADKLSPNEAADFEEHYLDCAMCIQAVEDAERLHRGLGVVAAEDLAQELVTRQSILTVGWHVLRSRAGAALITTLLVIGLLPMAVMWQRVGRLGDELESTRRELVDERRPRVNTPVLALVPTRTGEQPLQQISLHAEPEWIVLAIELGENARLDYEAALTTLDGAMVWESTGLKPSYQGTLTISLYSSTLPPGQYLLNLTSHDRRLSFPLRVVAL